MDRRIGGNVYHAADLAIDIALDMGIEEVVDAVMEDEKGGEKIEPKQQ